MRFSWLVLVLTLVTLLSPAPAGAATLRVMTYNLWGMCPGTDPDTRLHHMIRYLRRLDPDIIGLQEINESSGGDDNQAQVIADSLSAYFGVDYHVHCEFTNLAWDNQFRQYVGIISRFPVAAQGYGQLVPGVFPAKVVWNVIDTPVGRVNFFNTHLAFDSAYTRYLQATQIIGYVSLKESEYPGVASILVGDFNDPPESAVIQLLTGTASETFFIDTYGFSNPASPGFTAPAWDPCVRIDYVFEKNTGTLAIDTSMVVMDQPYDGTNYCSDHLGVLTLFSGELAARLSHAAVSLRLLPTRPNPCVDHAVIPFFLERDSQVSLRIHTVTGHHVRTLLQGHRQAGAQELVWDCRDSRGRPVASALYVIRLEVDGAPGERRIAVIR